MPGTVLTERFVDALTYAADAHRDQVRKGSNVPYVAHLLAVAARILDDNGTEDQAIAGLLHDAVEDQGGPDRLDDIRRRFGDGVADIVDFCTDTDVVPKPPWPERKQAYIEHLRSAAPDSPALRVVAADKLHNARSILTDHRLVGEELWERFSSDAEGQRWYYTSILEILSEKMPGPLTDELAEVVAELESEVWKPTDDPTRNPGD